MFYFPIHIYDSWLCKKNYFIVQVNLTELKTFPNPPEAVTNVMAAVMVLLAPRGRVPKDRSWKAARVFMGKVKLSQYITPP